MTEFVAVFELLPWVPRYRTAVVPQAGAPVLAATLVAAGFDTYDVDGAKVTDEASLFAEVHRALRLEAPASEGWAGFEDAFLALDERAPRHVAVLWHRFDVACRSNLQLVVDAANALSLVASRLGSSDAPSAGMQFEVFLLGEGPGFPDPPPDVR